MLVAFPPVTMAVGALLGLRTRDLNSQVVQRLRGDVVQDAHLFGGGATERLDNSMCGAAILRQGDVQSKQA